MRVCNISKHIGQRNTRRILLWYNIDIHTLEQNCMTESYIIVLSTLTFLSLVNISLSSPPFAYFLSLLILSLFFSGFAFHALFVVGLLWKKKQIFHSYSVSKL